MFVNQPPIKNCFPLTQDALIACTAELERCLLADAHAVASHANAATAHYQSTAASAAAAAAGRAGGGRGGGGGGGGGDGGGGGGHMLRAGKGGSMHGGGWCAEGSMPQLKPAPLSD